MSCINGISPKHGLICINCLFSCLILFSFLNPPKGKDLSKSALPCSCKSGCYSDAWKLFFSNIARYINNVPFGLKLLLSHLFKKGWNTWKQNKASHQLDSKLHNTNSFQKIQQFATNWVSKVVKYISLFMDIIISEVLRRQIRPSRQIKLRVLSLSQVPKLTWLVS